MPLSLFKLIQTLMKKNFIIALTFIFVLSHKSYCQKIVTVTDTMPGFTLPSLNGKDFSLSDYRGKNVMLVFPRGKVGDHWCQICHYQYVELAELEINEKMEEQYNLKIVYVLPYDKELVEEWVRIIPEQLKVIENWKNPKDPEKLSEGEKSWMNTTRKLLPKHFDIDPANIPTPFPILIDAERELSKNLGIFTTFWDYSYVEQNISSIFLIDKNGILQFKYIGQNTFDRPKPEYLLNYVKKMMVD
jgi:peroxiredoxin